MRAVHRPQLAALWLLAVSVLGLALALGSPAPIAAQDQEEPENGYIYVVQRGDNWTVVARRVGLTVEELKAANPEQAARRTGWLIVGERLFIPIPSGAQKQVYTVQPGDGWTTIAEEFGVSVRLLKAVNPGSVRAQDILRVGEELIIPPPPEAVATPSPTPRRPTATPRPARPVPTATRPPGRPIPPTRATPPVRGSGPLGCPQEFQDVPQALAQALAQPDPGRTDPLSAFLERCGLRSVQEPLHQDLTGDGREDWLLVYQQRGGEAQEALQAQSDLVVLEATAGGYRVSLHAAAAGQVELLAVEDVNQDDRVDVVFTDTTCGAHTCFTTVYVMSWTGGAWKDWTDGTITMPSATITLEDVDDVGQGRELVLEGGIINSLGAGPQRKRTEVWASLDGAPYTLLRQVTASSPCLYHAILDAEAALVEQADLETAARLFEEAFTDTELEACWVRANEMEELRSFALFRLALLAAAQEDLDTATALVAQLQDTYPRQPFTPVAQLWLQRLQETGDLQAACQAVIRYAATEDDRAVEALADYGYANPSFTAEDLCPLPRRPAAPAPAPQEAETAEVAEPAPLAEPPGEKTPAQVAPTPLEALDVDLPECPQSMSDYPETLLQIANLAQGDPLVLEAWLRVCDAMADERGALLIHDLNQDGQDDVIAFPARISDAGYGPGGAEGTVIVFHGQEDGTYTPAYTPDVFGLPTLLAVGDANLDGQEELIWQLESCSTFCVTAVEVLRWDPEVEQYTSWIEPGAALAEGKIYLEPVPEGDPGRGQQLRLVGGVSGTPGGGVQVAHQEIWQSVDGAPFRRIRWQYDREAEGGGCLGLRLVEADVLLQAADLLGYGPAIQAYRDALADQALLPCSVYEMEPEEERSLLRGLAHFRLVQALALDGRAEEAQEALAALQAEQGESLYAQATHAWLEAYFQEDDPAAACGPVTERATKQAKMWQITDQYGFDHPALAAEQICFVPRIPQEEEAGSEG